MPEEDQLDLMQLAKKFRARPDFLAKSLFAYQDKHQLNDKELAQTVGIAIDELPYLALCELPESKEEIAAIVTYVKADSSALMAWLEAQTSEDSSLSGQVVPDT